MTARGFFIAGTDTGVGKTHATAALLYAAAQLGYQTVGMKPVAAGFEQRDGAWVNDDVAALTAASTVKAEARLINPYALRVAIAPHIAAEQQGVNLRIPPVTAAYTALAAQADVVLVEGVGGLCVPLDAEHDMADLALALGLPVILVVGMRLGCLSHAVLTAEVMRARGLSLAAWVANDLGTGMAEFEANLSTLTQRLGGPPLVVLPWEPMLRPERTGDAVVLSRWAALLRGA
ncbi:MAG: dethiobiotin synthase [Betaproteobacteria bacterium]|nr:MAG: dethiobiotin synthase [Betaproteobacteria bacterium]